VIYQHYSGNQRLTHKEEKKNEPNHGDGWNVEANLYDMWGLGWEHVITGCREHVHLNKINSIYWSVTCRAVRKVYPLCYEETRILLHLKRVLIYHNSSNYTLHCSLFIGDPYYFFRKNAASLIQIPKT
jgi:hypothetical protein